MVSLSKGGDGNGRAGTAAARPARAARPDVAKVPLTRTVKLAFLALGVMALAMWIRSLDLAFHDKTVLQYVTDVNNKADKPVKDFDPAQSVHALRVGTLINTIVITVATLLIVSAMRRTRSASPSRWALLIILILTSTPFTVVPISGFPVIAKLFGVLAGAASIIGIVLVFVPESARYFRECREALMPAEQRGQPRPSLFRPRGAQARPAGRAAAPSRAAASRVAAPSAAKAKAKVRSDAEAVAKGAELARSRAKASKSRRPD